MFAKSLDIPIIGYSLNLFYFDIEIFLTSFYSNFKY